MNLQWNRTHTVDGRNTAPVDRWFLVCTKKNRVSTIQGDHPQHFSTQQRLNIKQQWTLTSSVYPDSCWSYGDCFLCCHGTWLSVSSICVSISTFATPTKIRNETQYLSVPKCTQRILSDMARLYPKIEYNYRWLWYHYIQLFIALSLVHRSSRLVPKKNIRPCRSESASPEKSSQQIGQKTLQNFMEKSNSWTFLGEWIFSCCFCWCDSKLWYLRIPRYTKHVCLLQDPRKVAVLDEFPVAGIVCLLGWLHRSEVL